MRRAAPASLSHSSWILFKAVPLLCVCGGGCHRAFHVPLSQLCICSHQYHCKSSSSLPFTVNDSTEYGLSHDLWRQHRPWPPPHPPAAVAAQKQIRPLETAQTTDIYMTADGNTSRSHQCGLQWQHNPWTTTWLQVSEQTTTIHTAFGGNIGHEQDLGPSRGSQWPATFLITLRIVFLVVALPTVCWILLHKSFIKIFTVSHRLASMPV